MYDCAIKRMGRQRSLYGRTHKTIARGRALIPALPANAGAAFSEVEARARLSESSRSRTATRGQNLPLAPGGLVSTFRPFRSGANI